jgi:hypothetical protein
MVELRPIDTDDYPGIAQFHSTWFSQQDEPAFWRRQFRFWWDDNPAWTGGVKRGWILVNEGTVVGFIGNIPTRFQYMGRETTVFNMTTWKVLPAFRAHSISLIAVLVEYAKETLLFNTTPTSPVARILESLQFKRVPRASEGLSVVVVDVRRYLRANCGQKFLVSPLLRAATHPILVLYQRLRHRRMVYDRRYPVQTATSADGSFDDLWERTKTLYPNTNLRNADTLGWWCFNPAGPGLKLFCCRREDRLVGFMVLSIRDRRCLECLDLWYDPAHRAAYGNLLIAACRYAGENGLETVVIPNFNPVIERVNRGFGLLQMKKGKGKFQIRYGWGTQYYRHGPAAGGVLTADNSYFTSLQGDAGLWHA